MPQMYTYKPNENTRLAVWHITEPETYFSRQMAVSKIITHPHKRLQHLAGRYLLQHLEPALPVSEIINAEHSKPYLQNHPFHFSISHSGDYAAAIVSRNSRVGIDIEMIRPRVEKIRHKFLTMEEERILTPANNHLTDTQILTMAWSAKECLFKWLNSSGVDFKKHLRLLQVQYNYPDGLIVAEVEQHTKLQLHVYFHFTEIAVLAWVADD